MRRSSTALRDEVAAQLEALAAAGGPLSQSGARTSVDRAEYFDDKMVPSTSRRRIHREIIERYLARQTDVPRRGKAALVTAGPPGSGKTTILNTISGVAAWRRLDADVIKTYLLEQALRDGDYDDLLLQRLPDGHPIMPAELASLVHSESVILLDIIRRHSLTRGENVLIEGTLTWAPAGRDLLDNLIVNDYCAVTILDVETSLVQARHNAVARWWAGRQARVATGRGAGGRFIPSGAIDRAFLDPDGTSICLDNARMLFDSPAARGINTFTLTVYDGAGRSHTETRRRGRLQRAPG